MAEKPQRRCYAGFQATFRDYMCALLSTEDAITALRFIAHNQEPQQTPKNNTLGDQSSVLCLLSTFYHTISNMQ